MKSIEQRINIIIGQLEGVKKMADRQDDCLKVLTQLKAIRSAVSGLIQTVVADKFDTCLASLKKDDKKLLINLKKYVTSN